MNHQCLILSEWSSVNEFASSFIFAYEWVTPPVDKRGNINLPNLSRTNIKLSSYQATMLTHFFKHTPQCLSYYLIGSSFRIQSICATESWFHKEVILPSLWDPPEVWRRRRKRDEQPTCWFATFTTMNTFPVGLFSPFVLLFALCPDLTALFWSLSRGQPQLRLND